MTLGDKEVATGPLLEKSSQKGAREAHDEAGDSVLVSKADVGVGESQNNG
jgi:hypothetical protein